MVTAPSSPALRPIAIQDRQPNFAWRRCLSSDRAHAWGLMDVVLTLSDVHPRDRLAYWHDVACKVFVRHECHVDKLSALNASIHQAPLGELSVIELDSTGLRSTAVTKHTIANQEDDVFILGLQL